MEEPSDELKKELNKLGKRAVACKGFRWMAGMKLLDSDDTCRLTFMADAYDEDGDEDRPLIKILHAAPIDDGPGWGWPSKGSGWLPDLSDPATLGCLHALVKEATGWGAPHNAEDLVSALEKA